MTPSGVPPTGTDGSPTPRRQVGDKSSNLPSMIIFVFGSNLAGIHGAGAAKFAVNHHGAIYTKNVTAHFGKVGKYGVGLQGNAYAIPTKDEFIKTLPLDRISEYVVDFLNFVHKHPEMTFNVTKIGCGLAGYTPAQIGPLFCVLEDTVQDTLHQLPNLNLPIEFGGTRDGASAEQIEALETVFADKDGEEVVKEPVIVACKCGFPQLFDQDEGRTHCPDDSGKDGEVASADASATSTTTDPNLDSMVINNIEPENAVRIYHSDAEVVGATTPAIESIETVCSKCGFCGPHTIDGYCHNKETGPHVSQYGKRIPTMHMNDDLIYGEGDKVYFKEDQYGNGSLTSAKLHTNDKGDLIQGLNLGEKKYRRDASQAEIDKAEGVHIRKFGCPCVKCTIGGIVEEDEEGTPTGATAADPLGYGDSFVSPRDNIFHKSSTDIYEELKEWINSNGIKGIDPVTADYMMRYENRRMIAHASIEYAPIGEWLQVHSSKKYSHNGGFVTKSEVPKTDNIHHYEVSGKCDVPWCSVLHEIRIPVYADPTKKSKEDTPSCAPYHKMGWRLDTCSCTPREQSTTFYMNVVGAIPDKDGTIDEAVTFHPERDLDTKIPTRAVTLLRTTFGTTTNYKPVKETYDHYSYVIPALENFVTEDTRLRLPYVPKGTKEELDAGDPRLFGTVKAPCRCIRDRKKMQCDCKYEDLEIDKGTWNSTHVMSNDPVKGKSAGLGDIEKKTVWYHKWYMQGKMPTIQQFGYNVCPEDKCSRTKDEIEAGVTHQHFFCKKWYSTKNPLGPNYPKETTPWQRNFAKDLGVILPDDSTYDQSFEILSYLFKTPPNADTANEKIALHVAQVAHMKEHTTPFPLFKSCDECGVIYTHQDEGVDSETGKVTLENNSIHCITGTQGAVPVPVLVSGMVSSVRTVKPYYWAQSIFNVEQQVVEVPVERLMIPRINKPAIVRFDDAGKYIRKNDFELAFVGSSEAHENGKAPWQVEPMRKIIRETITSAKEAIGEYQNADGKMVSRLVVSSGGAIGVDTMAEEIAIELGVRTHIYNPDIPGWEDGVWDRELQRIERGYKSRNIMIAQRCCKIYNLVGKAPKTPRIVDGRVIKVKCKFCNMPHYSSGGCFTANKAFWLGKDSETIAV